jgi:hypothetical protein
MTKITLIAALLATASANASELHSVVIKGGEVNIPANSGITMYGVECHDCTIRVEDGPKYLNIDHFTCYNCRFIPSLKAFINPEGGSGQLFNIMIDEDQAQFVKSPKGNYCSDGVTTWKPDSELECGSARYPQEKTK